MPEAKDDLATKINACDNAQRSCLVAAILIEDKNKRIDAALKCLADHADCVEKAAKPKATPRDVAKLMKWLKSGKKTKDK